MDLSKVNLIQVSPIGNTTKHLRPNQYEFVLSDSSNAWYTVYVFSGSEIDMLKVANELLNGETGKQKKYYHLWISNKYVENMYKDITVGGLFKRNKKLLKLIKDKESLK